MSHQPSLIKNIMIRSKFNECAKSFILNTTNLLYFISKYNAGDENISSLLKPLNFGFCEKNNTVECT